MIVVKQWRKFIHHDPYYFIGVFLLGFIPLFIFRREATR